MTKNILVTGAAGFIGKNLSVSLMQAGYNVLSFVRGDKDLSTKVKQADVIFHLAGVNRPHDTAAFVTDNIELTQEISELISEKRKSTSVFFSSSKLVEDQSAYGLSKDASEKSLGQLTENHNVSINRLPGVFGKWAKPNYNNVIATWCYNLHHKHELFISNSDRQLEICYIDDFCRNCLEFVQTGTIGELSTSTVSLGLLKKTLEDMYDRIDSKKLPYFETELQRHLYSTLISYQSVNKIYNYQSNANRSGSFSELIHGPLSGQISYLSIEPLGVRGNHYHHSKIEKFFILDGTLEWVETDIRWPKETHRRVVKTGDTFYTIPGVNHIIKNLDQNESARIIIWASEIYDDENSDTFKIEKMS